MPENFTSLLKPNLMFLQYSSSTNKRNNKYTKQFKDKYCNAYLFFPKSHYIDTLCVSVVLSFLPHLLSNKDVGSFRLHYPCPAEVSFHVLPRPVVCQAAQRQARLSLPTHPLSCRLLNNAICRSPLTRPAPFTVLSQRNAVKGFRRVYTIGRKIQ